MLFGQERTRELREVRGRKEERWWLPKTWPRCQHQIFPPLPPLEHNSHSNHVVTNTFSFTSATDLPNNKPTLLSSPLFLHSAIHSSMPSNTTRNAHLTQHLHHIAHIYHPHSYHTSSCQPRVPLTPSST